MPFGSASSLYGAPNKGFPRAFFPAPSVILGAQRVFYRGYTEINRAAAPRVGGIRLISYLAALISLGKVRKFLPAMITYRKRRAPCGLFLRNNTAVGAYICIYRRVYTRIYAEGHAFIARRGCHKDRDGRQ